MNPDPHAHWPALSPMVPLASRINAMKEVVGLFVFGHIGLTISAFSAYSWADLKFRGNRSLPPIDYRFIIVGAMLPDIVDKPLGIWIWPNLVDHSLRSIAHGLLFGMIVLGIGGLLVAAGRRPSFLLLSIASLGHLILDRMWRHPAIFLWPALGWDFANEYSDPGEWASGHLANLLTFFTDYPELLGFLSIVAFSVQIWRSGNLMRFLTKGDVV